MSEAAFIKNFASNCGTYSGVGLINIFALNAALIQARRLLYLLQNAALISARHLIGGGTPSSKRGTCLPMARLKCVKL